MSPDIKIYDQVKSAVDAVDRREQTLLHDLQLPDITGDYLGDDGSPLRVNMDGINGRRAVQHLVLSGDLIGERVSIQLNNQDGRGSKVLPDGRQIDVYVPKATDQTRRIPSTRRRGERKKPLNHNSISSPYFVDYNR